MGPRHRENRGLPQRREHRPMSQRHRHRRCRSHHCRSNRSSRHIRFRRRTLHMVSSHTASTNRGNSCRTSSRSRPSSSRHNSRDGSWRSCRSTERSRIPSPIRRPSTKKHRRWNCRPKHRWRLPVSAEISLGPQSARGQWKPVLIDVGRPSTPNSGSHRIRQRRTTPRRLPVLPIGNRICQTPTRP